MRRQLAYAVGVLLATAAPLHAVDLTGPWFICEDCSVGGVCDPFGQPPPHPDTWGVTQTGTNLSAYSTEFNVTFTGAIDPTFGTFHISWSGALFVDGVGTFSTIDGTYNFSSSRATSSELERATPRRPRATTAIPAPSMRASRRPSARAPTWSPSAPTHRTASAPPRPAAAPVRPPPARPLPRRPFRSPIIP